MSVEALLDPRTIAVLGASADEAKISGKIIPAIQRGGFKGRLFGVNPGRTAIGEVPCYPSVEDIPEEVDVAVIAVALPHVESALESCAKKGVAGIILHTGGFGETGVDGQEKEQQLREFARRTGIRILGPNCQGVLVPANDLCTTFNGVLARPDNRTPGNVAWISQSGAVGGIAVTLLRQQGLGLSLWVSTGNEADLEFSEFASYALDQPGTAIVAGYMERIRDIPAFRRMALKALEVGKPVLVVKGGRSESGAAAAASHTGAMVGDDRLYQGLFAQLGVIAVPNLEELAATAALFAKRPQPAAARQVGILGNSGGTGVVLADLCADRGLTVPTVPAETVAELSAMLPDFIRPSNPVDIPMQIRHDPTVLRRCIEALDGSGDSRPQAHIVCLHSVFAEDGYDVKGVATALADAQAQTGAHVMLVPYGCDDELTRLAREHGVTVLRDGPRAVQALANMTGWAEAREHRRDAGETQAPAQETAQETIAPPAGWSGGQLSEYLTKSLLSEAGLPVTPGMLAKSQDEAVAAAERLGYPLVMKLVSPHIAHKTDVGALKLRLADEAAIRGAHAELRAVAASLDPQSPVEVLVEKMAEDGDDAVVALRRDPDFGPVLVLGIGGVLVEALDDIAVRPLPVTEHDVHTMLGELKLKGMLSSERGREAGADVVWLARFVTELQDFFARCPWLAELELNPVRLYPSGQGGVVLDALSTGDGA